MSSKAKASLDLTDFKKILAEIEKAEKTMNGAAEKCMQKVIQIAEKELKSETRKASDNTERMIAAIKVTPPKWPKSGQGDVVEGGVGWTKGKYDPKNPSEGYKAIFLNCGTPKRKKSQVQGRFFIQKAKKKINEETEQIYEKTLNEILKGLK